MIKKNNNISKNRKPLSGGGKTKKRFIKEEPSFKSRSKPKKSKLPIIIGIVIVLGIVGFFAMQMLKPETPPVTQEANNKEQNDDGVEVISVNKIMINSASWGRNCDNSVRRNSLNIRDTYGETYKVEEDNVLDKVTAMCEGKRTCEFTANNETFGFDPAKNCIKLFEVVYRCFSYDTKRKVEKYQSNKVYIDCSDSAL